jgi:aspartyl-tRNA(Asn)/glutamyl-tRNA(Gln) amidotransferase subunit C
MLSDAEMAHLKTLARLELSDTETEALKGDLNKILGYFETLNELDTEGVEELARPVATANVFRTDEARSGLEQARAEALAVETENGFFKVPRTVEGGE